LTPVTPRTGRLLITAAALLWSSGGLAIKLVPLPAAGVAFWRSLLTALFLIAVLRPGLERWRRASWTTALIYAAMILSFISATKMTTASNAIFALSGMTLFFVGRLEAGALAGNVVAVLSGLFFGGVILFLRRDTTRDAMASVLLGNLLAALLALPLAQGNLALDLKGAALVVFLGVVQMGISYILYVRGLSAVPAAEASLLSMLEPVLSPIWVFIGIGERPTPWALIGGAVVLGAVAGRTVWGALRRK